MPALISLVTDPYSPTLYSSAGSRRGANLFHVRPNDAHYLF